MSDLEQKLEKRLVEVSEILGVKPYESLEERARSLMTPRTGDSTWFKNNGVAPDVDGEVEIMALLEDGRVITGPCISLRWTIYTSPSGRDSNIVKWKLADEIHNEHELELHRADHSACREAGFHDAGELLSAYNTLLKRDLGVEKKLPAIGDAVYINQASVGRWAKHFVVEYEVSITSQGRPKIIVHVEDENGVKNARLLEGIRTKLVEEASL